jgi:hypothetical protein
LANCTGHILCGKSLLHHVSEGKIQGRTEATEKMRKES